MIFTSGGTEAINLAIKGAAWAGKAEGPSHHHHGGRTQGCARVVPDAGEVRLRGRRACRSIAMAGSTRTNSTAAMTDKVILVSLQLANNEVGTIQALEPLLERVRPVPSARSISTRSRAPRYLSLDVDALGADLVSLRRSQGRGTQGRRRAVDPTQQGHPAAAARRQPGALPSSRYRERSRGGGHGRSVRAGDRRTCTTSMPALRQRRDRLRTALLAIDGVELTGHGSERLPGSLSVIVRDLAGRRHRHRARPRGHRLLDRFRLHHRLESSHRTCSPRWATRTAEARGSLRLSLGRSTTDAEIDMAAVAYPRRHRAPT